MVYIPITIGKRGKMNTILPSKIQEILGDPTIGKTETGSKTQRTLKKLASLFNGETLKPSDINYLTQKLGSWISADPGKFNKLKSLPQAIFEIRVKATENKAENPQTAKETAATNNTEKAQSSKSPPTNKWFQIASQFDKIIKSIKPESEQTTTAVEKQAVEEKLGNAEVEAGDPNIDEITAHSNQGTGTAAVENQEASQSSGAYRYQKDNLMKIPEQLENQLDSTLLVIDAALIGEDTKLSSLIKRAGKSLKNGTNISEKEAIEQLENFKETVFKNKEDVQTAFNKLDPIVVHLIQYKNKINLQASQGIFAELHKQQAEGIQAIADGNALTATSGFSDKAQEEQLGKGFKTVLKLLEQKQKLIPSKREDFNNLRYYADQNRKFKDIRTQIQEKILTKNSEYNALFNDAQAEKQPDLKAKKLKEAQDCLNKELLGILGNEDLQLSTHDKTKLLNSLGIKEDPNKMKGFLKKAFGLVQFMSSKPESLFLLALALKPIAMALSFIPIIGRPIASMVAGINLQNISSLTTPLLILMNKGMGKDQNSKTDDANNANDAANPMTEVFKQLQGLMGAEAASKAPIENTVEETKEQAKPVAPPAAKNEELRQKVEISPELATDSQIKHVSEEMAMV